MSRYAAPAVVGGLQCIMEGSISLTLGQEWREPHKIGVKFPRQQFWAARKLDHNRGEVDMLV